MHFLDGVYISEAVNGLAQGYKYYVFELFGPDIYVGGECKDQRSDLWHITPPGHFVYWYKNILKLNRSLNILGKTDLCGDDMLLEIRCFSKAPR